MDKDGNSVTESQYAILRTAECAFDTPALPRREDHHELVKQGMELLEREERSVGGQLGPRSGARSRTYERLTSYAQLMRGTYFVTPELQKAIDEICRHPLQERARDALNRQFRAGITDEALAGLVVDLWREDRLCNVQDTGERKEPRVICSMGLLG